MLCISKFSEQILMKICSLLQCCAILLPWAMTELLSHIVNALIDIYLLYLTFGLGCKYLLLRLFHMKFVRLLMYTIIVLSCHCKRMPELPLCLSSLVLMLQFLSTCNNQPILPTGSQSKLRNLMMFTGLSFLHHSCEDGFLNCWS